MHVIGDGRAGAGAALGCGGGAILGGGGGAIRGVEPGQPNVAVVAELRAQAQEQQADDTTVAADDMMASRALKG